MPARRSRFPLLLCPALAPAAAHEPPEEGATARAGGGAAP